MMKEKRFVGMYNNDAQLMTKIDDLKRQGIDDDNMYVVTEHESDVSMFKGRAYVENGTHSESWLDRFMNFITGEDHVHGTLHQAGVPKSDLERYHTEIRNGGKLLYVDEGEVSRLHATDRNRFTSNTTATDPNLGANAVSEYDESGLTGEVGQPQMGSTGAFQDTPMYEGRNETFGRAGGEALRDDMSYRTPPNNQTTETDRLTDHTEEERMQLREERLRVDKQQVEQGEVSLHKDVVSEQQSFDVPVSREEVYIERRPVNETQTGDFTMQEDEETIRVPVMEERVEVTKTPYVAEEIVVGKRTVQDTERVDETVRHEEAHFDKTGDVDVEGDQLNKPTMRTDNKNERF